MVRRVLINSRVQGIARLFSPWTVRVFANKCNSLKGGETSGNGGTTLEIIFILFFINLLLVYLDPLNKK